MKRGDFGCWVVVFLVSFLSLIQTSNSALGVEFISFVQGDPGVPGDGIFVTTCGVDECFFDFEQPLSLSGVTDGITITVFPSPNDLINFPVEMEGFVSDGNICSRGFGIQFPNQISFNGLTGFAYNFTQTNFETAINFMHDFIRGCENITIDDISLFYIIFDLNPPPDLDAVAIGFGQNNVPISSFVEGPPGDPTCSDEIDNDEDGDTDLGDTNCAWQKLEGPWDEDCDTSFGTIAIDPTNPDTLYIGSSHITKGCGLYKSSDGGQNWASINNGFPKVGIGRFKHPPTVSKVVIAPSDPNILYAGTFEEGVVFHSGRIYKSENGGRSWTNASGRRSRILRQSQINKPVLDIAVDPQNPDVVYAGIVGDGVYKTTDGGKNWTTVRQGTVAPGATDYFSSVKIAPSNPNIIYVTGFTRFSGPSFPCSLTHCVQVNGVLPLGPLKSVNGGQNWISFVNPVPISTSFPFLAALITDLIIDPLDHNLIYSSTMSYISPIFLPANNEGVFKSTDGGMVWEDINDVMNTDLSQFPIYKLVMDEIEFDTLYAIAGFEGIFKTINNGNNWDLVTMLGLPFSTFVGDLGVADQRLYALASSGIYVIDQDF